MQAMDQEGQRCRRRLDAHLQAADDMMPECNDIETQRGCMMQCMMDRGSRNYNRQSIVWLSLHNVIKV